MMFLKMTRVIILIAIVLSLLKGQVFLSGRKNFWYGLIFPCIAFVISLGLAIGTVPMSTSVNTTMQTSCEEGGGIKEEGPEYEQNVTLNKDTAMASIFYTFFAVNSVTIVLLAIYFICRGRRKTKMELRKMRVEEL